MVVVVVVLSYTVLSLLLLLFSGVLFVCFPYVEEVSPLVFCLISAKTRLLQTNEINKNSP